MSISQGPWTYEYDNEVGPNDEGFSEFYTVSSNYESIARVDSEDDARLISVSPQLLLALEDAAGIFRGLADVVPLLRERVVAYDNLIAKARGTDE